MSLTTGVVVERVGDDLMVVIPGNNDVVTLSGRPAAVLLDVKAGKKVDTADPALRDLVDCGILSAPGLSRRGLIKAGAIGAGAGIAVLAMPGVVAAASENNDIELIIILPAFNFQNLFEARAVPRGYVELPTGVTVQSSTATLSDGTVLTDCITFNGYMDQEDGIQFILDTLLPFGSPVTIVSAELVFTYENEVWTARFSASAP
jgi:hypothetical protein